MGRGVPGKKRFGQVCLLINPKLGIFDDNPWINLHEFFIIFVGIFQLWHFTIN